MTSRPELSVIIPAYRAWAVLTRVLAMLEPQIEPRTEVLVIDSSGPSDAVDLERVFPWLRLISLPSRVLPGEARNVGAQAARGSRLVFLDADAVPATHWLARLRNGGRNPRAVAVAGAVRNGTPRSAVGTASYLLEFAEWTPGRRGTPLHAAGCNLLIDRGVFERAGGFRPDIWPGEDTILTIPWGLSNRLEFARDAAVWHLNRTRPTELLRHQYRLGRAFAAVCDSVEFPHRRFSRWPMLAAAPGLRLAALGRRLAGQPELIRASIGIPHLLIIGLGAWATGLAAGRSSNDHPRGDPEEAGAALDEALRESADLQTPTPHASNPART